MPTTVMLNERIGSPTCLPIASWPGQYFLAIAALTIATGIESAVSVARKSRPWSTGVPTAAR